MIYRSLSIYFQRANKRSHLRDRAHKHYERVPIMIGNM
uniref:Uncharacterized protein n=1 Tax=Arundo donax TaxID=35708 RepID=A0A0A9D280_ARUDO